MTLEQLPTPIPFLEWEAVVSANDPSVLPTRSKLRTARDSNRVSLGIQVPKRAGGRAAGSTSVHSVLTVLAIHARYTGYQPEAEALMKGAQELEDQFAGSLKIYLRDHDINELSSSSMYTEIVVAMHRILDQTSGWRHSVFAWGSIESIGSKHARLLGTTTDGERAEVDVPRQLTDRWLMSVGDEVLVFQRMLPTAAIVELLPVVSREARSTLREEKQQFLDAVEPARDANDIERLRDRARIGSLPRRTLRPAG